MVRSPLRKLKKSPHSPFGPQSGGSSISVATYLLRNDGSYILRNDGFKIERNARDTAGLLAVPSGFGSVPFDANFYKSGSTYSTDFVAEPHIVEGGPGVTTYYVDIATGDDSNAGTSGSPFKTLYKALFLVSRATAPTRLVKVKGGTYKYGQNMQLNYNATSLAVVSWDGNPVYITDEAPTALSWTLDTSNTYYASCTAFGTGNSAKLGAHVWDGITPDADGDDVPLSLAASLAACRSTPGTFWRDDPNDRIYVHTTDNRAPDSNIKVYEGWGNPGDYVDFPAAPVDMIGYFENLHFRGGQGTFTIKEENASYLKTAIFKNCSFKYARGNQVVNTVGNSTVAFVDCVGSCGYGDIFSINAYGSVIGPGSLEINVEARRGGILVAGSAANQGSTIHSGAKIVRLNGYYHHNESDQIADVNAGTLTWCLGCEAGPGLSSSYAAFRAGNGTGSPTMWLDGCTNAGSTYDVASDSGCTVYKRDFTGNNTNTGSGTVTTY